MLANNTRELAVDRFTKPEEAAIHPRWQQPSPPSLESGESFFYPQGSFRIKTIVQETPPHQLDIFITAPTQEELKELLKLLSKSATDPYTTVRGLLQTPYTPPQEKVEAPQAPCVVEENLSLGEFLQPIVQLEKGGHIDAALDVLYDRVDDMLKAREFATIDLLLKNVKADSISVDIILGLLTASLPARSKLEARARFFTEASDSIKKRGAWEDGLLTGLES